MKGGFIGRVDVLGNHGAENGEGYPELLISLPLEEIGFGMLEASAFRSGNRGNCNNISTHLLLDSKG